MHTNDLADPVHGSLVGKTATLPASDGEAPVADSETEPLLDSNNNEDTTEISHKATNLESMFHIVCVIAGTGLLQIPYALAQSGWLGILLILLSAWMTTYSGELLADCLYQTTGRLNGFPEIGLVAFGIYGFFNFDL